jgi:hypothetical protein
VAVKRVPGKITAGPSAIGYWLLAIGYWLLAIGYWLLAIGYWLLAIGVARSSELALACKGLFRRSNRPPPTAIGGSLSDLPRLSSQWARSTTSESGERLMPLPS